MGDNHRRSTIPCDSRNSESIPSQHSPSSCEGDGIKYALSIAHPLHVKPRPMTTASYIGVASVLPSHTEERRQDSKINWIARATMTMTYIPIWTERQGGHDPAVRGHALQIEATYAARHNHNPRIQEPQGDTGPGRQLGPKGEFLYSDMGSLCRAMSCPSCADVRVRGRPD